MHARSVRSAPALAGLLLAAALTVTGCGASDSAGSSSDAARYDSRPQGAGDLKGGQAAESAADASGSGSAADSGSAGNARTGRTAAAATANIIRTASLSVRVKDVPKALDEARTAAEDAGGYVGRETTTRDAGGRGRTKVVLRVPVGAYQRVLDDLEGSGRVLERSARAEDVTDQVVDVESRIRTQRASVARIRELMDRATRLSDVVELEGELSARQADLESLLARQASLKDRTGLATITLSLSEAPAKRAADGDDGPGFGDALSGGWDAFLTTLRWIALVLGAVLPFAVTLALAALVWLRIVRPRMPRRTRPAPAQAPGPLPTAPPLPRPARSGDADGARSGTGGTGGRHGGTAGDAHSGGAGTGGTAGGATDGGNGTGPEQGDRPRRDGEQPGGDGA